MLNPNSPLPLYHQLAEIISERITSGKYPPGLAIPSETALARQYHIGRPTVRQAMDLLAKKKMIVRRRGSGTFVQSPGPNVDLFSLAGTSQAFYTRGIEIQTTIVTPVTVTSVADQPHNPFNESAAYFFSRLIQAQGDPVIKEDMYLDIELFRGLDRIDLGTRSLSRTVAETYHLTPENGTQVFTVAPPDADTARMLALAPDTPVLTVFRELNFPDAAKAVYAVLYCRTDRFAFSQTIGNLS
jgi:GntR family transcriptional regulator